MRWGKRASYACGVDEYKQHPARVTRWDGRELLPVVADDNCTVWVTLLTESARDSWEGLRAVLLDDDVVEIRSVPAYVHDLNYGDRMSVMTSAEGALVATGIVGRSDQRTYRIWLPDRSETTETWESVAVRYSSHGALIDVVSDRLIAISCEREHSQAFADELAADERAGVFHYETGAS